MPLERMIPDLQASFACEDVRVEASGAHTIVGIVNFIGAPRCPSKSSSSASGRAGPPASASSSR
jgi:hypothetical protein